MVRLLIVDDQEIVRTGLRRLLEGEPDIEVMGEAADAAQALHMVRAATPDVILMDIKMPGMDGIAATQALKQVAPAARILILTVYGGPYVGAAISAGADGYLSKDISAAELIRAVRTSARGASPVYLSVPTEELPDLLPVARPAEETVLSRRQLDVLRLVAQGDSNADIARKLVVSERTVKRELSHIFQKLGVNSRVGAVARGHEQRLI